MSSASPDDLIRDHGPTVFAMCRRLTDEPEDAYQTGPLEDKKKWQQEVADRVEQWRGDTFGDRSSLTTNTSVFGNDDHESRFVIFGAYTGSDEVKTRTGWRLERMVENVAADMQVEARSGQD